MTFRLSFVVTKGGILFWGLAVRRQAPLPRGSAREGFGFCLPKGCNSEKQNINHSTLGDGAVDCDNLEWVRHHTAAFKPNHHTTSRSRVSTSSLHQNYHLLSQLSAPALSPLLLRAIRNFSFRIRELRNEALQVVHVLPI